MIFKNKKIIKVILAILIWVLFWFSGQAFFFSDYSFLPKTDDVNINCAVLSAWVLSLSFVALFIWKIKFNDFSFLKIKNKKVLWLYLIVFLLILYKVFVSGETYGINPYLWVLVVPVTTFFSQDVLTFGFLQTYLGKTIKPFYAFLITSGVFFAAHLTYDFSIMTLVLLTGAFLFGFLRYKTKNIYYLNFIHEIFGLVS